MDAANVQNRREFLKACGLAGLGAVGMSSLAEGGSPSVESRPNIILIMADDFGDECVGAYGSLDYQTPNLDGLAETGLRFTHCYSQPLCTPSRVQIMTGRYNHRNYIGFGVLDRGEKTFAHMLKDAGYRTCVVGKWQLGKQPDSPRHFGFDEARLWHWIQRGRRYWQPVIYQEGERMEGVGDRYGPDVLCEYGLEFMERNRGNPFFLYYPMALTHSPFCPTPDGDAPKSEEETGREYFKDMVEYTDKIVGRIVSKLEELGIRDNTILLFTGDNGTGGGRHRTAHGIEPGGKGKMTDAGTRVPLIVNWPAGGARGVVCDDLVDFSDFLPTFADAAGTVPPQGRVIDGRSFLPRIRGEEGNPREWVFCHYWGHGRRKEQTRQWARNRRYKLYDNGDFYDIEKDSAEESPIKEPQGEALRTMQRLRRAMEELTETG
jgi:arylsulfatase A